MTAWPLEPAQKEGLKTGQEEETRSKGNARESQGVSKLDPIGWEARWLACDQSTLPHCLALLFISGERLEAPFTVGF